MSAHSQTASKPLYFLLAHNWTGHFRSYKGVPSKDYNRDQSDTKSKLLNLSARNYLRSWGSSIPRASYTLECMMI